MAAAPKQETPPRGEEFIFVEHKGHSLEGLEEQLNNLREDIEDLYYLGNRDYMFMKKFFELFVAFSVLVTPIAMAFLFNHLTDQKTWSFCEVAYGPCNEGEENGNKTQFVSFVKSSSASAFRQAVVFTLISLSFFVGIPYYYFTLDQLHRLDSDLDEDESDYDDDDRHSMASGDVDEPKRGEGDHSETEEKCEKDGKSRKNRKKGSKKETKREKNNESKDSLEKATNTDPQSEAVKLSRKQLDNFD